MSGISGLEQNIILCVVFSALGGVFEVFATACLAYPAARIIQGFEWTDRQLKCCLAANISLQIIASLSGNLFATWFGPVSIVGPIFFAAQLLANLVLFWIVLGIEAFSREMQVGTYVIVISVVLLLDSGPTAQEYSQSFDQLILHPAAVIWSALLVVGMMITGAIVLKARLFNMEKFDERNLTFKFAVLLIARGSSFALNLTSSKAFLVEMTPAWYIVCVIIKVVSGAIYTMSIVVQSTAVQQRTFVPVNAATTILLNAVTGMLVWNDWKNVQSWVGYVCVFLLLILGCALLLGDLSLLQEAAPETFRGGRFAMTLSRNRNHLLNNLRNFGNTSDNIFRRSEDEEAAVPCENPSTRSQEAWAAIFETGRAAPRYSISTRTMRRGRKRTTEEDNVSKTWSGPITISQKDHTSVDQKDFASASATEDLTGALVSIPTAPPDDFKYTKGTCALSWWRPIKLLGEGSISDIHLVKRRKEFYPVKYKEKREVMELAKRKTLFWRHDSDDYDNDKEVMVLKSIIKSHIGNEEVLDEMRREISVMSHLRHPNIVRLYEAYERHRHVYLIMEYCPNGNLTNKNYNEHQCAVVTRKILSALQFMHLKGVAHRDVKLENIMVDRFGEIKLIDFGLATKYQSETYANLTDTVGTLYSMAPQVLEGSGYDFKADMWSVGVVTYVLLSQTQPFWGPTISMSWPKRRSIMMSLILKCEYAPMKGGRWEDISQYAKEFVGSLLQYDPKDRPTAAEALECKWIQSQNPDVSLVNVSKHEAHGLGDPEAMKTLHHASEFRRKAWGLLSTRFSLSLVEPLEKRLGELDTTVQGFVGIEDLLLLVQEIGGSTLTNEDIDMLRGELGLAGTSHRIEYIDFIIDVKRGLKRNLLDKLAATLDEMDTDNSRQIKISDILSLLDKEVIPDEFRGEFLGAMSLLQDLHGDDGTISTLPILQWMEKRMAQQQSSSIEHA
ncbi:protein kinase domain containing protein [Nitzschia inconspicua]|uniref:Protein kinase domain containing protein n=1 Tax=Nitzschia inconspicua TaxID=303405 RepID=A0A9K3LJR8_9STRA|nr:protein kinase domain containing protein [Nitzschia inconspicua]